MPANTTSPPRVALLMLGRLTVKDAEGNPQKIVIQRVGNKFGNGRKLNDSYQLQVRRHVETITDRMSGPQLIRRGRFTAAVQAWQGLSDEERRAWKRYANRLGRIGYNLFLSRFMRSGTTPPTPS